MKARALYLVALLAASQMAAASDLSTAFAQGQAMGAAGKAAAQSNITAGQAANVVPNYTSSATESSYFSGGQGSLSGPALSKVSGCATGAPNPEPYKRQECEAVNFLAKNPAQRQQFGIGKSDPLLAGAKPILANPAALAGSVDGSYSACSTQSVDQPAQYSTEVCNQYADMAQSTCQRVLNVQASRTTTTQQTCSYHQVIASVYFYWTSCGNLYVDLICPDASSNVQIVLNIDHKWDGYCSSPRAVAAFPMNPGAMSSTAGGYYAQVTTCDTDNCMVEIWNSGRYDWDYGWQPATKLLAATSIPRLPTKQVTTTTINQSWDNQCSALEARAQ